MFQDSRCLTETPRFLDEIPRFPIDRNSKISEIPKIPKAPPYSTPNGAELTMLFVPARIRSRARQKGWGPFSNWYKSREGGLEQGPFESPPLGGGLWARTCAVWCLLMHGSYRQGEGTNGGRLRVFSSAQAPWRVLLQALDQPSNSGKWNLGQYCTVQIRKGCAG